MTAILQLKQLTYLQLLTGTRVTSENVHSLKALPNLIYLNLGYDDLDSAAFDRVGELTKLIGVGLIGSHYDESDLERLKTLPSLEELTCSLQLSDAGLLRLGTFKHLQRLHLKGSKVTAAGVAAVQIALPNCQIEWDEPAKATTQPAASASK